MAVNVFISYSHKDASLREELETHLALLRRQGAIDTWHDRRIEPGAEWRGEINEQIVRAQVILLLVSSDFVASEYCYDVELKHALSQREAGKTRIIPIILRPCEIKGAPFAKLSVLPRDGKAITTWRNRDEAWREVTRGLRDVLTDIDADSDHIGLHALRSVVHTSQTAESIILSMLPSDPYGSDVDGDDVPTPANVSITFHCPSARYLAQPLHYLSFTPVAALCLAFTEPFVTRLKESLGEHAQVLARDPVEMRPQERTMIAMALGRALTTGFVAAVAIPKPILAGCGNLKLKYQTIANALVLPLLSAHRSWGADGVHLRVGQRGDRDSSLLRITKSALKAVFPRNQVDFVEDTVQSPCALARVTRFVAWAVGRHYNDRDDAILKHMLRGRQLILDEPPDK